MAMLGLCLESASFQDDVSFAMSKALNGEWRSSTGATFRILIGPRLEASCICTLGDIMWRHHMFANKTTLMLWCDDSCQYLWLGMKDLSSGFPVPGRMAANMKKLRATALFTDVRDVLADANKLSWFAGTDWQKTRPVHSWVRSECSSSVSVQPVAKHIAEEHVALHVANARQRFQPPFMLGPPPGLDPPPNFALKLEHHVDKFEKRCTKHPSPNRGRNDGHSESDTGVGSSASDYDTDDDNLEQQSVTVMPLRDEPRTKLRLHASSFVPRPCLDVKLERELGFSGTPRSEGMATTCGKDNGPSASGMRGVPSAFGNNDMKKDNYDTVDIELQPNAGTFVKDTQRTKLRSGARRFVPVPVASNDWQQW